MPNRLHSLAIRTFGVVRRSLFRIVEHSTTVRARIITAFIAMSLFTAALGGLASYSINNSGKLVVKTFDESLMAINYARAAAADFANMQTVSIRRAVTHDPDLQAKLDVQIDDIGETLSDDLTVAEERSQSDRAKKTITAIRQAVDGWTTARQELAKDFGSSIAWASLDSYSQEVDREIDLLVNYTAGDGFIYREHAKAAAVTDLKLNLIGTFTVFVLSGLTAWLLARRIIGPVATASAVANRIAQGKLDGDIPSFGADELGLLLQAMRTMRDNIRAMMEREVAQRRSAQARLADALESSQDGIVVVDAAQRIALANAQAADFLGTSTEQLAGGTSIADLTEGLTGSNSLLTKMMAVNSGAEETRLGDGRWLRISRSATRDGGFIALCSDISVQKDQEAALKATNIRLDAALGNMSQGLCLYGPDNRLQVVNRRFCEMFGQPVRSIVPGMSYTTVVARMYAAGHFPGRSLDTVLVEELRIAAKRERDVRFLQVADDRIVAVAYEAVQDGGWLATYEDVTERRHAEERIAFMAKHDALTNLPNRTLFTERVMHASAQAKRGVGCAILCLDLDFFKTVNDTLGHPFGDALLREVADRLTGCIREIDTVARLGGDEFAIVQCGVEHPNDTVSLADRIIRVLSAPFLIDGHSVSVGVSIGISLGPNDATDHTKLLKNADVALYRAKEEGRGTWRFFEAAMDSRLQARREMELDLRRALEDNQFELYYQPLFDLASDRIGGFEALLRWNHPSRGKVAPNEFIPLAEEIGIIREIGAWVLKTACAQATLWPGTLKVAVNVSPVQLKSGDFYGQVATALAQSGLPANRLDLEITESIMLGGAGSALETLNELRALGTQLSMDDFGTGYSSLMSLRSFPFNKIKIDKSFVQDLASPGAELVIRAVVVLGGGLGMRITAEGVETAEQLARLRMEGCNEIQGYFISPPVPALRIPALLDRWSGGVRRGLISAVA